ncbi:MAG: RnfABCDGE type electron transport complex subunit G [Rikenellaceae bacterium]
MKSTLINMVLVLFAITAIASASVGGIYLLTKEPIALAEENAKLAALEQVLDGLAFEQTTMEAITLDDLELEIYTAQSSAGDVIGYAINTATMKGFSGLVRLMVGIKADGTVNNVNVISHNETPGLGSKMADEGNSLLGSVQNKNIGTINWEMTKNNGDIEALTAATISSVAYADAMQRAMAAYNQVANQEANCCQEGACDE